MHVPEVNYAAVVVGGIAIFILGGLWYSPILFAKKWVALMGKTEEELRANAAGPSAYVVAFLCGLVTSYTMAVILSHFDPVTVPRGILVAVLCWIGFAGVTSFSSALFSGQPKGLWLINSGYNLVAFIVAAVILSVWRY